MKYIILAAGKGTRLHPLTLHYPKCLFNINKDYSILQRTIDTIRDYDKDAEIITVVGFMHDLIENKIKHTKFINNPFFHITNSIASLWFAKEHLDNDCVIINGDVVVERSVMQNIVCQPHSHSSVLIDSSIKTGGDYNVQIYKDDIVIMSKDLHNYYGEYTGIIKLAKKDATLLKSEIINMINNGDCDQWYENTLVQLIFNQCIVLKYIDICLHEWTEIDCADDLLKARLICKNN